MKALLVFYSRTGKTRKVGQILSETLKCDIEEIIDTKNRMGFFGWLRSGYDALRKKITTIYETKLRPSDYEVVIIGTPNWGGMPTPAIRTYINQHANEFNKVAFFCTCGGSGVEKVFAELDKICGQTPIASLDVRTEEVEKGTYRIKIKQFTDNIK